MSNNQNATDAKPAILVDVYGRRAAPDAAKFGVGTRGIAGVQQAIDARRNAPVGKTEHADRNR